MNKIIGLPILVVCGHGFIVQNNFANFRTYTRSTNSRHQQRSEDENDLPTDPCSWNKQSDTLLQRRDFSHLLANNVGAVSLGAGMGFLPQYNMAGAANVSTMRDQLRAVKDPKTFSALAYVNPAASVKMPLLLVLHGAGINQDGVWSLADPKGEHAGLIPSLIATNKAPLTLVENFAVVVPYASGKRSFYEEPRSKLLSFLDWVCSAEGQDAGCPNIDPNKIFLFGFSDGATVAVELATTRRFKACVICSYGYTGILPDLALQRLKDIPMWVFHSADDVIFPVSCGDQLVKSLRSVSRPGLIRYTRYDFDQEGFTGDVKGHSVGITASKLSDLYSWMLSLP